MTEQKICDLDEDTSKANLAEVWDALDTPKYRVVDEDGVNVAGAQIRRLARQVWLYVDDSDGYDIIDTEAASRLLCVREEDHVPLGWDGNGGVVEI